MNKAWEILEVEVIYKDEIEDKLPRYFFSKLEAKKPILLIFVP